MRDFDTSGRSSDTVAVFTPCPIHCQGYRRPIFPAGLATDTTRGLATDAQARRNISHYQFIVNTAGCLLSQLSQRIWGAPVCTGTTGGGGAPGRRHPGGGGRGGERIHGPHIVIPATAGIGGRPGDGFPSPRERRRAHPHRHSRDSGGRRWVPVSTGTTVAPTSSFPRRREGGDGFPSPRERRGTHRHSRDGGNPWRGAGGWVPVSTGTTVGGSQVISE